MKYRRYCERRHEDDLGVPANRDQLRGLLAERRAAALGVIGCHGREASAEGVTEGRTRWITPRLNALIDPLAEPMAPATPSERAIAAVTAQMSATRGMIERRAGRGGTIWAESRRTSSSGACGRSAPSRRSSSVSCRVVSLSPEHLYPLYRAEPQTLTGELRAFSRRRRARARTDSALAHAPGPPGARDPR